LQSVLRCTNQNPYIEGHTYYNGQQFEDTKGVIRNRTSLRERLQWSKVWRYQRRNHSPYIEGQTTFGHCSVSVDARTMTTPLVSSNVWPLQSVLRCTDSDYSFGIFKIPKG
jgi:hypothetical protein